MSGNIGANPVTVLSNREVTILRYLVSGLSNKEIADKLLLSNKTVSAHKSNIYGGNAANLLI